MKQYKMLFFYVDISLVIFCVVFQYIESQSPKIKVTFTCICMEEGEVTRKVRVVCGRSNSFYII